MCVMWWWGWGVAMGLVVPLGAQLEQQSQRGIFLLQGSFLGEEGGGPDTL